MASAFCNTCSTLVPLNGVNIRKVICKCGSINLSAVAGKWNEEKGGWDYTDRKGDFKIHIPVDNSKLI